MSIPIAAMILKLFSNRARVNGASFLAGWIVGISVAFALVYALADVRDALIVGAAAGVAALGAASVDAVVALVLVPLTDE